MQSARLFIMYLQISRRISSSSVCPNIVREGKFMKKILNGSSKSKRKWYDSSTDLRGASINLTDKSPSVYTQRRMVIRDKLFMQHITDMMSMGEVYDITKGNIEITHVKITQDFNCVNVFYIPSNDDASLDQEALQKCARIIRHELSQLRIIGIVPPIQFVQNKQYFMEREVERRLAMIKEDILCSEQFDTSDVSSVGETSHKESVANHNSEADEFYIQLPAMRHDVLGLDHHRIMSQIVSAVSKSKKKIAQRRILDANTVNECDNTDERPRDSKETVEFLTQEEQRKIFSEFLIKRQREQRRHKWKKSDEQKMLNNLKEEIDEESDYEDNIDDYIDNEYIDNFEDEMQK